MSELNRKSIEEYKSIEKFPVIVALDNVRSALNVGSVLRTSDALLIEEVLLLGKTPSPLTHQEIKKTALGGEESVKWNVVENELEKLKGLKKQGYKLYGVEQTTDSIMLQKLNFEITEKAVFIFGNEVTGVQDDILALCDKHIEIPQFGTKHSFNISVSVGIVLWHSIASSLK